MPDPMRHHPPVRKDGDRPDGNPDESVPSSESDTASRELIGVVMVTVWRNSEPDVDTDLHPWLTAAALGQAWERMENEAAEALEPPGEEEGEPEDD